MPAREPNGHVPGTSCEGEIGSADPVAVVELKAQQVGGNGPTVLRDYADPAHPRTVCTFHGDTVQQLIDPHHIVITGSCFDGESCGWAVLDLPDLRYHWFAFPRKHAYSQFEAVSPDLDEIAWISMDATGQRRRLHLTRADGDHVVAPLSPSGERCGIPDDSAPAAYTRSGSHLYILDYQLPEWALFLVLNRMDKVLSRRAPEGVPLMPVWSPTGETLYYRLGGDIWRWTQRAGAQRLLSRVTWRYPTISPDGRYLAYAVQQPDNTHNIYLMDLAAGSSPTLIGHRRTMPMFLTATQLWYVSEAMGVCGPGLDRRLIYDVNERSEAASIIEWVKGIWPATSSQLR
jgi:hypothetical protein